MHLTGKKVAILVTDGFEESELTSPLEALKQHNATVHIVAPDEKGKGKVRSWADKNWGSDFDVDVRVADADPDHYDALVLPGGVINPDKLRMNGMAVEFIRSFFEQGKPVAAICHGLQTLIEADVVSGRRLTSYPSVKTDLRNAGADWVDEEVVVDEGLVTSRSPKDLPAFNAKMVEEFAEGRHEGQAAESRSQPRAA